MSKPLAMDDSAGANATGVQLSPAEGPSPDRVPFNDPAARKRADIELVRRMCDGDREALQRLYQLYAPSLLGLAIQILRSREEAEEILQEVLVQAWRQADRYDPGKASVRTWLTLMTRSRAIDRRRINLTRHRTAQNAKRLGTLPTKVEPEGVRNVWLAQLRKRLRLELSEIPPTQRQIVELIYFRGLTQVEVAERIQIPLGTVKTRTLLAMKKLRQALGPDLRGLT